MPAALALVGAAASVSAGVAAGGIIGGVMIAGGVMTGLGAITGNKKLQKWGGILSIAGGVAGLASGAWSSAAGSIAEQSAESVAREGFRASELGAQYAGEAAGAAAGGLADASAGMLQANLGVTDIGVGAASAGGAVPGIAPVAAPVVTGSATPTTVNLVNAGGTTATAPGLQGVVDVAKEKLPGLTANSEVGGGMLSKSMSWMKKNPRLTQAGAGLLTAGLSAYGQSEAIKEQMRMQEEQQARARKRLSDSVQGVTVPVYQRRGG
jgi:hypothetical protein